MNTPRDVVTQLRELLKARGGTWPEGFEVVAAGVIHDLVLRAARHEARDRLRLFLRSRGGVFEGSHGDLGEAVCLARETVSRNVSCMADVTRFQVGSGTYRFELTDAA